jgi:hypothetical protein
MSADTPGDRMSVIERDRAKAIDAMTLAIGVRSKVRDSISDMLDAALDSGALVWASNHAGAVSHEDAERARGWLGLAQGAATPERAQEYIAKALAALGGQ